MLKCFLVLVNDCLNPFVIEQPNPVTGNDVCAALGEQLPLSDAAVVAEESSLPVPTADFVTEVCLACLLTVKVL